MKKIISLILISILLSFGLIYKSSKKSEAIIIYTSTEDYNMNLLQQRLNETFPNYEIVVEYMSTSNIATKVLEEGSSSECDIIFQLDYSYLDKLITADRLAHFDDLYDLTVFENDTITASNKNYVIPTTRNGGCVIINNKVLEDRNIEKPTSYQDLLKPEFKNLISMPSPKSSSTGYMFLLSLVNAWGEETALEYFDGFSENVMAYTSSGSGPVNALSNREVAVGLGMTSQAVDKITKGNSELEVVFFDEGSPYALLGSSIVKGKETRKEVIDVFSYIYSSYVEESCKTFYPEPILKDKIFNVENFPSNIVYSNMNNNSLTYKENLLKKWKY